MIEAALVTVLPAGFLILIFGGGALFLRKKIEQDGEAPINRTLFFASKYSIIILWGAMAPASWEIGFPAVQVPRLCSSLRSRSGLPDSRSSIPAGSKWGIPFVLEPRRRRPTSKQTGYSG